MHSSAYQVRQWLSTIILHRCMARPERSILYTSQAKQSYGSHRHVSSEGFGTSRAARPKHFSCRTKPWLSPSFLFMSLSTCPESSIFITSNTSQTKPHHGCQQTLINRRWRTTRGEAHWRTEGVGGDVRLQVAQDLAHAKVCDLRPPKHASQQTSAENPVCVNYLRNTARFVSLFRYNSGFELTTRSGDAVRQALHLWQQSQPVAAGDGRQGSRPCK